MTGHILDCTIRDGGLMNAWRFDAAFVRRLVRAVTLAGAEYVELGYKASDTLFSRADFGPWRFGDEADLEAVWEPANDAVLTLMVDVGRFDVETIPVRERSLVGAYRVACYAPQVTEAVRWTRLLRDKGYQVFLNLMAVSEIDRGRLVSALREIRGAAVEAVSVVDSYGALTPSRAAELVRLYREETGHRVGFHGHNNLQLALANSLAALEAGAEFVDGSLAGMGRGAGNTPIELLLPMTGRPWSALSSLLALAETDVPRLQESGHWGYEVPYLVSGLANQHPREAMALLQRGEGAVESGYWSRVATA